MNHPLWYALAACAGNPEAADWFYEPQILGNARRAKRVCRGGCEVVDLCLEQAIAVDPADDFGIWGGSDPQERARMRAARAATTTRVLRHRGHPSIFSDRADNPPSARSELAAEPTVEHGPGSAATHPANRHPGMSAGVS